MPLPADYVSTDAVVVRGTPRRLSRLYHQTWTNPAALVANGYVLASAGPNATTDVKTLDGSLASGGIGRPDFARGIRVVATHATAVVTMTVDVEGTDVYGRKVSETLTVPAGGVSQTVNGKKAFRVVTKVSYTAAGNASANTVTTGTSDVLGLDVNCAVASAVKEVVNGAIVTTGTVVAKSAVATDDPRGTYLSATATNGTNDYEVVFVTDDPEAS